MKITAKGIDHARPYVCSRWTQRGQQHSWRNYLYLVPIFVFVGGLIYSGLISTVYVSMLEWNGISAHSSFVWFNHYLEIARDPIFLLALAHTAIFGTLTITIQMALGLALAIMLHAKVRLKMLYKIIFFVPVILASSVTAYVFRHIFDANTGDLNMMLRSVGLRFLEQAWLANPKTALFALAAINIWQWTGLSFLMYYAGLTQIESSYYEAARLDGAGFARLVWHITIPLLRSTHVSLIILGVIGALKTFDIVFLVTGGGPGRSTEFLSTYIYKKAIQEFNAGYASALSVVMLVIALLLTVLQLRAYRKP